MIDQDKIIADLIHAAKMALSLLRGSGFTENTQAVVALKNAIWQAEKEWQNK